MGKTWSVLLKPLKSFNIENRAHRVISKEKLRVAPKYKSDEETLRRVLKENPNLAESYSKKSSALDERLKNVFVSSTDPAVNPEVLQSRTNPDRPLPSNKELPENFEFGVKEPETVPPGRLTLRSVLALLAEHSFKEVPAETLAVKYNINEDLARSITKYYGAFNVHLPEKTPLVYTTIAERLAGKDDDYKQFLEGEKLCHVKEIDSKESKIANMYNQKLSQK